MISMAKQYFYSIYKLKSRAILENSTYYCSGAILSCKLKYHFVCYAHLHNQLKVLKNLSLTICFLAGHDVQNKSEKNLRCGSFIKIVCSSCNYSARVDSGSAANQSLVPTIVALPALLNHLRNTPIIQLEKFYSSTWCQRCFN